MMLLRFRTKINKFCHLAELSFLRSHNLVRKLEWVITHRILKQVLKNMDISNTVPKGLTDYEPFSHSCGFWVVFLGDLFGLVSFGDKNILCNKQHHSIDTVETVLLKE